MTFDEFSGIFHKLKATFGEKNFLRDRSERIYKFCQHLTATQFDSIIDDFIDHSRIAPLPWDFIVAMRNRNLVQMKAKDYTATLKLFCGHPQVFARYVTEPACIQCLRDGNLVEIQKFPYMTDYIPEELREQAQFFQRQNNESFLEYTERTWQKLREIHRLYGLVKDRAGAIAESLFIKAAEDLVERKAV